MFPIVIRLAPMDFMPHKALFAAALAIGFADAPPFAAQADLQADPALAPIQHIVVMYLENRSFDNLFGLFPGADGLQNLETIAPQVDANGVPYRELPPALDGRKSDGRVKTGLPNRPYRLDPYIPLNQMSGDLTHAFFTEQLQIDGGRMDRFISAGDSGSLPLGFYDGSPLAMWKLAREFTLTDHFFHGAFGGSLLNHFWLVCACTGEIPLDAWGKMDQAKLLHRPGQPLPEGAVWADQGHFWAVNTIQTRNQPHRPGTPANQLLPPQTQDTIGDRLSEKGIGWVWYSGGWNDALAGNADSLFQFHHQPFAYFAKYGDDRPARADHLKDETDFIKAIDTNRLPAVSFWKPIGRDNQHPGYATILTGDLHAADIVAKIRNSPAWKSTVIIVTYDEHGGTWDHVAPPKIDQWGPGTRIPTIVISPFAKKGFVDHTIYDTTSILKLIENRYGLRALGTRDAQADGFSSAFDFAAAPAR